MGVDRYDELFPGADDSVELIALDVIVSPDQERALRSLDIVAYALSRVGRGIWAGAIILIDDVWMLPPLSRRDAALAQAREFLAKLASVESSPALHIPLPRWKSLRESFESAAHRVRMVELMDWDEESPERKLSAGTRAELRKVQPSWTPMEVGDAIIRLGYRRGLPRRKLFNYWFRFHQIEPNTYLIAQLPSGRRISVQEDGPDRPLTTLVEPLISAILSDTMDHVVKQPLKRSWDGHFAFVAQEINNTVERTVMCGMHPDMAQLMLWAILQQLARQQFIGYMVAAFPHLQADPDRLADTIGAAKRGAVLILGHDADDSLQRLKEIRDIAERQLGLSAVIIKEQPELIEHGLIGKLHAYGAMARFVIVENSHPSGHLYELPHLKMLEVVTVVLQERGKGASRMPDDSLKKNPLVRVFTYTPATLERVLTTAAAWAERRLKKNAETNRRAWNSWYEPDTEKVDTEPTINQFRPWETGSTEWTLGEEYLEVSGAGMRVIVISEVVRDGSQSSHAEGDVPNYPAGTTAMVEIMEAEGANVLMPARYAECPPVTGGSTFTLAIGFPATAKPRRFLASTLRGLVERGTIKLDERIRLDLFLMNTERDVQPRKFKLYGTVDELMSSLMSGKEVLF
jgi:hypothetical protein